MSKPLPVDAPAGTKVWGDYANGQTALVTAERPRLANNTVNGYFVACNNPDGSYWSEAVAIDRLTLREDAE